MSSQEALSQSLNEAAEKARQQVASLVEQTARNPVTIRGGLVLGGSGEATGLPIQSTTTILPLFPW